MPKHRRQSRIEVLGDGRVFVELTRGKWSEISRESLSVVQGYAWRLHSDGYATRDLRGSTGTLLMHRAILEDHLGRPLGQNMDVEHVDRSRLNNVVSNLEEVLRNQTNRKRGVYRNNTSGEKGVSWYKSRSKWQVRVQVDGKTKHLGLYDDFAKAVRVKKEFLESL